jgi:hypothetical protein
MRKRRKIYMEKNLTGIEMGKTWLSYIGSVYGILTHAGMWDSDVYDLAGSTGMAFQFIIHKSVCPSSVTVYDWNGGHFLAMDRIGVYTDCVSAWNNTGLNTGKELMEDTFAKIKESIDRGIGVLVWAPSPMLEFGIITGYDDAERIFNIIDCMNQNPDPLLYDNLGKSEVSMLYIQRFFSKKETDKEKTIRDSLSFGLERWRWNHFDPNYASGAKAYDAIIASLVKGDYNQFGLSYIVNVYADSKKAIAQYLGKIGDAIKGIDESTGFYEKISSLFAKMAEIVPFRGPNPPPLEQNRVPDLVKLLEESSALEAKAMNIIEQALEA